MRTTTVSDRNVTKVYFVPLSKTMASQAFVKGFQDVRAGRPLDDAIEFKDQWKYERGRQFATIYTGRLNQGRGIARAALDAYSAARKEKAIL